VRSGPEPRRGDSQAAGICFETTVIMVGDAKRGGERPAGTIRRVRPAEILAFAKGTFSQTRYRF
jgi:hypothetical protein